MSMSMAEEIRVLCVRAGNVSDAELARRLNTTPQNWSNKLKRDRFTVEDMEKVAEALGYELKISFEKKD